MTDKTAIDCNTDEGIAVGTIDAILTLARLFRRSNPPITDAVKEALLDLASTEDLKWLIALPPENVTKFEITRMTRGATKNSGSPMWRCVAAVDTRVNICQHSDPAKDTYHLFNDAGYTMLLSMLTDESATFDPAIPVECVKNGD